PPGAAALLAADVEVDELLARVQALAVARPEDRIAAAPPTEPVGVRPGRVVGVAGPVGGAGVTELALEVAAQLAAAGRPTVLVDADELSPSLAQRLGLPVHPNLHTAVRAVARSAPVDGCLHPLASRHALSVLPGMATADDWHTVRADDVVHLLGRLRSTGHTVVVDLGHCLPRAEGPTGMRFGHGRALAAHCSDLVVAATPTPTVLARTIDLVAELTAAPGAPRAARCRLHVVLNRTGTDRYVTAESVGELRRAVGASTVHVIGEDPRVPRAAWQGARVGRGRFRRQVRDLVEAAGWTRS
ncbi:CpaE family protein, partial [Euzebya sp.]|uniref:AAA family ATPase n=1 Tax=Euzebya sp. TaxID=1971409 RepID=UPI003516DCE7